MPSHDFGIINSIDIYKDYSSYNPKKYNCIKLDDDILLQFIKELNIMPTYFNNMSRHELGLAYYGVTLIPPNSLNYFKDVLIKTKDYRNETQLFELIELVTTAIKNNKFIIHYGI